ncbi:biotin holocarboxylase synthetase [Clonorchis sinensis]|uniref:Biotin holocarboxylase synthetase n=1 Tax=Clonorchis sinensis TaxID=79923 RepID=A0A419QIA6_CLOSI|nr:biotin holocarboxylase synthetase [Clonorchis sinensis]
MKTCLIQLYNDTGSGKLSSLQLRTTLQTLFPKASIIETDGRRLCERYLLNETTLLCFGGGYDLGFLETLGPSGCAVIRDFIQKGGRYLGLCAGAYFASDQCVFDKGGPLEVCGQRFIRLFEGDAVGPYYPGFVYHSNEGCRAASVERTNETLKVPAAVSYFNGGPTFQCQRWHRSKVLYTYGNSNDPAIIACRLGRGWGVLSGVHFEYDPKLLYEDDPTVHVKRVCDELWAGNECRMELLRQLVGDLLNPDSNLVSDLPCE